MSTPNKRTVQFLDVEKLLFDPENPRIPSRVTSTDDAEVFDFMIKNANIVELMGSIGTQGFFSGEPLLVVLNSQDGDAYIVVEGNRRLAAVKLLLRPDLAPSKRKSIEALSGETSDEIKNEIRILPVLVFDNRDQILGYLGYRHITGIQTWGSLAKAEYLKQLLKKKERDLDESMLIPGDVDPRELDRLLAKEIGSRANHVGQLLSSLAVYEKIRDNDFFEIDNLNEETLDFGVLYTAIGYSNIYAFTGMEDSRDRELINLNVDHLRELAMWMFEKDDNGRSILGESRNLDQLDSVVGDQDSLRRLRSGDSLESAYVQSKGPRDTFVSALQQILRELEDAWNKFRVVKDVEEEEVTLIREIMRLAGRLKNSIESALLDENKLN